MNIKIRFNQDPDQFATIMSLLSTYEVKLITLLSNDYCIHINDIEIFRNFFLDMKRLGYRCEVDCNFVKNPVLV